MPRVPPSLPPALAARLLARWREPHRRHHGERHLDEVLTAIEWLAAAARRAGPTAAPGIGEAVEAAAVAAWFHDVVHDGRPDDEERSAALARTMLEDAGCDSLLVDQVVRLVLLTRTHDPVPDDRAGVLLCDADLCVLGADATRYAEYVRDVRAEYGHVDDESWRSGRAEVLRDLLALDPLFRTAAGRDRWEGAARDNMATELAALTR